jgi:methyl-accepting chemotaxis protein
LRNPFEDSASIERSDANQAARGTGEVSSTIGGVAQSSVEVGTAAAQVLAATRELSRQSEKLRRDVAEFLATVRAA